MNLDKYKYKTTFASTVRCVIDEEKDAFLSKASIEDLSKIIPGKFFQEDKIDLLPISANVAVINTSNLNGDAINGTTALAIYKSLIDKYINWEHKRSNTVCGHVVSVAFSKFNSNYINGAGSEIVSEEDIKKNLDDPFNMSFGGVLYRLVNPDLIEALISSSNPFSDDYLNLSSSWEIMFDSYSIIVNKTKYTKGGRLIKNTDADFEEYDKSLLCHGGTGKKDNDFVFRLIDGDAIFAGLGIVQSPAALVKGIVVSNTEDSKTEENESNSSLEEKKQEDLIKNSVINDSNLNQEDMLKYKTAENKEISISSAKEITDEVLKNVSAASVQTFIAEEIEKASEIWNKEKTAKENAIAELENKNKELEKTILENKTTLTTVSEQLAALDKQVKAKDANDLYNQRMESFDTEYDLTDEDRQIIASDIKEMDENAFSSYAKKMAVFFKTKKKGLKVDEKKEDKKDEKKESKASVEETKTQTVVETAVSNAVKDEVKVTNTPPSEISYADSFKEAFSLDKGFVFSNSKKKH